MIKNVDLLYSITSLLDDTFGYNISLEQYEEVKAPTFFIKVSPLTNDSFLRYNEKLTNIVITYVDKVIIQESLLNIQNSLDDLFDLYIDVNKRKIVFDKKKFNITSDFLSMTLTLNYIDDKTVLPDMDKYTKLMEILNLNEEGDI